MPAWILDHLDSVGTTSALLLPGYVAVVVRRKLHVARRLPFQEMTLQYLAFSALCLLATSLIFWGTLVEVVEARAATHAQAAKLVTGLLVSATVFGGVVGLEGRFDVLANLLSRLGIQSVSACDSGWDRAFGRKDGCLVRVERLSGESFFATFGHDSCVATVESGGDCFFQQLWIQNASGDLEPKVGNVGVWIGAQHIKTVEFYEIGVLDSAEAKRKCKRADECDRSAQAGGTRLSLKQARTEGA